MNRLKGRTRQAPSILLALLALAAGWALLALLVLAAGWVPIALLALAAGWALFHEPALGSRPGSSKIQAGGGTHGSESQVR